MGVGLIRDETSFARFTGAPATGKRREGREM